jgi:hypothetical protein
MQKIFSKPTNLGSAITGKWWSSSTWDFRIELLTGDSQ